MVILLIRLAFLSLVITVNNISFYTHQRADIFFSTFFIEFHGPVHRSVIRDTDRSHLQFLNPGDQIFYFRKTVQKRIFGVVMKMYKISHAVYVSSGPATVSQITRLVLQVFYLAFKNLFQYLSVNIP